MLSFRRVAFELLVYPVVETVGSRYPWPWMVDGGDIPSTPKNPPLYQQGGCFLDLSRQGCRKLTLLPRMYSAFVRPSPSLLGQFTLLPLSRFVVLSHRFVSSFCLVTFESSVYPGIAPLRPEAAQIVNLLANE
jgi:hypothetical protein